MRLKNPLASLGVAVLAAGLVAAPISPASAVQPTATTATASPVMDLKLVWQDGPAQAWTLAATGVNNDFGAAVEYTRGASTADATIAKAATFTVGAIDQPAPISYGGSCLHLNVAIEAFTLASCDVADLFVVRADGAIESLAPGGGFLGQVRNLAGSAVQFLSASLTRYKLSPRVFMPVSPLTGRVDSVDSGAKTAKLSGTATAGAEIWINGRFVATAANGTWSAVVAGLVEGWNPLEVEQRVNGSPAGHLSLVANVEVDDGTPVTAQVTFDADLSKEAVIHGTGETGAVVVVTVNGAPVGPPVTVVGGIWSLILPSTIGAGSHELQVRQDDNGIVTTAGATADFGSAVALDSPTAGVIVPGITTVSGSGSDGAQITVSTEAESATTTVVGGSWKVDLELPPTHEDVRIATSQHSRGNLWTSDAVTVVPEGAQTLRAVAVDTPVDGRYTANKPTTITGTATPYSTINVVTQWGTQAGTATADSLGKWTVTRVFGPSAAYVLDFTQTLFDGRTQSLTGWHLDPDGAFKALSISTPTSGDTYDIDKPVIFTGLATPGATVVATTENGGTLFSTRASQTTGAWSVSRVIGPDRSYRLTFTQTAADQTTDRIEGFILNPAVGYENMTVTSPKNGDTYRPGTATFTGTGTPGALIRAVNQWGSRMGEVTVGHDKIWSFTRNLGPTADYIVDFAQTLGSKTDTVVGLRLASPVWHALELTSPSPGETYRPGELERFSGFATPFATIAVKTSLGGAIAEVEAAADGSWTFDRRFGPDRTYILKFAQTALDGRSDALPDFIWAPAGR